MKMAWGGALCLALGPMAAMAAPAGTRTSLAVAAEGSSTVLRAHVVDGAGAAVSGGVVSFELGAASLGAVPLDRAGEASLAVRALPVAGGGPVVAVFHPASEVATPASSSAVVVVHAGATGVPDFMVTATPTALTAAAGGYTSSLITVKPMNGYNAQVTLSCLSAPPLATCTFSPVIDSTAGGEFTSTVQVQTQSPAGSQLRGLPGWWGAEGTLALGCLLPLGLAARQRRRGAAIWMILGCTAVAALGLGGCSSRYGYNHHPPSEPGGTPVGNYTFQVLASGNTGSAVTEHSVQMTLAVQ
jgi:hypothetical protein